MFAKIFSVFSRVELIFSFYLFPLVPPFFSFSLFFPLYSSFFFLKGLISFLFFFLPYFLLSIIFANVWNIYPCYQEKLTYLLNLLPLSPVLNQTVLRSVASISVLDPTCHQNCVKNLQLLVKADRRLYLHPVLQTDLNLDKLVENNQETVRSLVETIFDNFDAEKCPTPVIHSALNLLQNYGHLYRRSPYLLEDIFSCDRTNWDPATYHQLLAAAHALFAPFPAAMQPVLSNIFHQTLKVRDHHLQLRVRVYYSLLHQAVKT